MAEEKGVSVHGMWASPFSRRVELALKVKGIPYKYVEEDLQNKSPSLLEYNPVHKKIPVLVHDGKPIAESLVILEYIEETWKNNSPQLLPHDPYKKAQVRFWVHFVQQKFADTMMIVITTDGETHEKALNEVYELLKVLEEGMKSFFPNGAPPPNYTPQSLNLLDIVAGSVFCPFKACEQVLGIKLIDPERTPLLFSWVKALSELPLMKETTPPHEKLVEILKYFREVSIKKQAA